jgi:hypothetical protein
MLEKCRRCVRARRTKTLGMVEPLEARRLLSADIFATYNDGSDSSNPCAVGEATTAGQIVNAALITGFSENPGIAISGNDLFITNWGTWDVNNSAYDNATIDEYTTSGTLVQAGFIRGITEPSAIAISGSDIFITETLGIEGTQSVLAEYTLGGELVHSALISNLDNPVAMAIYGSDLYISTSPTIGDTTPTIAEYTTSGATVNATLVTGAENTLGPWGLAADATDLFLTTGPYGSVSEYTTSGATVNLSLISGLEHPSGIAVLGNDLYVEESSRGRIGEYTLSGATVNASLIQTPDTLVGMAIQTIAAPANIAASNGTYTGQVSLTWDAATGATSYQVFRSLDTNFADATKLAGGITTDSYIDTTAVAGTDYYYWVVGRNASIVGDAGGPALGFAGLPAPANFQATSMSHHVTLTWAAVGGAVSYQIFRGATSDFSSATRIAAGLTTTNYNDLTGTPGVLYYYWVRAKGPSAVGVAAGPDTSFTPLAGPVDLTASTTNPNDVALSWEAVTGATSYQIFRSTTDDVATAAKIAAALTDTNYNDTTAAPGVLYYYWVRARNPVGLGNYSLAASGEEI